MKDFEGVAAVVTGGASGIGLAIVHALARRGCRVAIIDVEAKAIDAALSELHADGSNTDVRGFLCDVSARQAVETTAEEVLEAYGPVQLVFANAGVGGGGGPIGQITPHDWKWTLDVNLMGMIHTVDSFLPAMQQSGAPGHIVYTASMAGMVAPPHMGSYNVTKFATVAMAETLAAELAGSPIKVSVLCPGFVSTRIHESDRNRPEDLAVPPKPGAQERAAIIRGLVTSGITAELAAERVMEAVAADEFYIFTHPDMRQAVEDRFTRIRAGFDAAAASPVLGRNGE